MRRDLGDFQTPPALVSKIIDRLQSSNKSWTRALEPTCGQGNFIAGLLQSPLAPSEIQGIEVQSSYAEKARQTSSFNEKCQLSIITKNIFEIHVERDLCWQTSGPLLVIGNPPWVTNSELGTLGSSNLPSKSNLKKLTGLEALTGSSNFDIAEYIWLKLIGELFNQRATIALLCKTTVARNVLQFVAQARLPVNNAILIKIDAQKWFSVYADACLFCLDINAGKPEYIAPVYDSLEANEPISTMGFINGQFVSDIRRIDSLNQLDGLCQLQWRQGLKHDAASIVELTVDSSGAYRNKLGQWVEVESDYIFPLLKSSDLAGKSETKPRRAVIVPQRRFGENTAILKYQAPLLWHYLNTYRTQFDKRKSSIYLTQPPFAFFGLGDYSFAPFKVAISGMYKTPVFRLVAVQEERPVMLDDTCYFLACSSVLQAALITSLLNSQVCLELLHSIIFWDAKRPITKKVLQRLDLYGLLKQQNKIELTQAVIKELNQLPTIISPEEKERYISLLQNSSLEDMERLIVNGSITKPLLSSPNLQPTLPGFMIA